MDRTFRSVIFASDAHVALLAGVLPGSHACAMNGAEFAKRTARRERAAVAFVDIELLFMIDGHRSSVPIVAITDGQTLPEVLRAFELFPWLSHVTSAQMLASPVAAGHLALLIERLTHGTEHAVLGPGGVGRAALLAQASKRDARFDRIDHFFARHRLSGRTVAAIHEVSEELVMNALYDAPLEAGYFKAPVPRTQDVELSADRACEISYGVEGENVFVRVRDPFGALTRGRLLDTLDRCNSTEVVLDESRGGAGLGLWRVFSSASSITITVVRGKLTDILVGMTTKNGRICNALGAIHLFLTDRVVQRPVESAAPADDRDLMDQSVTLLTPA